MFRGVVIFSLFAFATVMIIVLQPGPRPVIPDVAETTEPTRNQTSTLLSAQTLDTRLPAGGAPERTADVAPEPVQPSTSADRLTQLQAAREASLAATRKTLEPRAQAMPTRERTLVGPAVPELRDMSWQTLNTLMALKGPAHAPGQEGSLLNSIVRRSMSAVGGDYVPAAVPATTFRQQASVATVRQASRSGLLQSYVVTSGDTLALISIKLYGSALEMERLLSYNPELKNDPNNLRIGQVLNYRP